MKDTPKDSTRQKRILDICDRVLESEPERREDLLNLECGRDSSLRAEVDAMLSHIRDAEYSERDRTTSRNPLNLPNLDTSPAQKGDVIADFNLLEEIGSGGMGSVFRAQRIDSSNAQQVAVKVLNAQIVTPEIRLRFNVERDILSRLRHPYIAGLIDGGTTKKGTPYLAMELVDGVRIDDFCDNNKLTIGDRLELLSKVAHALQHAHQNLIIHRDIKPSNVLVTPDGIPKLVDFGIAKLLSRDDRPASEHGATTYFGGQALTPDFASPEQLLDGKVSTSSDIYSMGILAILLLTGRKPYDLDYQSPKTVVDAFEHTRTWRASSLLSQIHSETNGSETLRAIAEARNTTPAKIRKRFQGDLDTVLAKATRTEPERRYATIEAFAQDLINHRKGLPVNARGDSLAYRSWSLIRMNRLAFSVVGATVAALSVGLAAALWQAQIANDRFTDLHQFASVVLDDIYESVVELPGSTPTRKLIAQEAQHYLDRLAKDDISDPALLADLSLAYRRIADVQGRPSSANLGESEEALKNYAKAKEIAEKIANETPSMTRARAQIYRRQGELLAWQGDVGASVEALSVSKVILQGLFEQTPEKESARVDLAYNIINLGDRAGHPSFQNQGNPDLAIANYQEAIELLKETAASSKDRELLRCYSVALERAGTLALETNKLSVAQTHFLNSSRIRSQLALDHPDHMNIQRDAGIAIEQIAKVQLQLDDDEKAIDNFKAALKVYQRLLNIDPDNASARRTVAIGHENLGDAILHSAKKKAKHYSEQGAARAQYAKALGMYTELIKSDPNAPRLISKQETIAAKIENLQPLLN